MIVLHTASTPNGRKVSIADEEQRKSEFLALNPNHKIPVLEDDGLLREGQPEHRPRRR